MTTGNWLTGRLAEHLVCAELARRNLIATTFTHNVPRFDVLVTDDQCRTVPIQVKGTNDSSWTFEASTWMDIRFDETNEIQIILGEKPSATPDLIWVCVVVKTVEQQQQDQFFILTERDIQQICVNNYRAMLEKYGGHRPRSWKSLRFFWNTDDLVAFVNKWEIIQERLKCSEPVQSLPS